MIKNEKQYNITQKKIRDFQSALEKFKEIDHTRRQDHLKQQIEIESLKSDIKALRTEIREFEKLKTGKIKTITAPSFEELPALLIKARIARSMSQKELAAVLGLKEQQIQRYEQNNYASASLSRVQQIIEALQINIEEKLKFL